MTPTTASKSIRTPDGIIHRFPSDATDEQINETLNPTPTKPQSTMGKVGDFLKGHVYDPTIGSIGQGMRDVATSGSRLKGTHEMISGTEAAALPIGVAAAISNPEVTLPAMAVGYGAQKLGHFASSLFTKDPNLQDVVGDVSGLVGGGLAGKYAPEDLGARVLSAAKVGGPDIAMGAGKIGAGAGIGYLAKEAGVPYVGAGAGLGLGYPGARQLGRGVASAGRELFKGPVKAPGKIPLAPPPQTPDYQGAADMMSALRAKGPTETLGDVKAPKGPSVGQLTSAAKSGTITPEQFDASVDKMPEISQEAKDLHKANLRTQLAPKAKITPDEPPKELSLGHLQQAVKAGQMDLDEYNSRLAKQGYNETDRGHLTELLKRSIEDEEEAEALKTAKTKEKGKVEPPKKAEVKTEPKTPPKVEPPSEAKTEETNPFLEEGAPHKPKITEQQIEESQSDAREAKENKLAKHFADKNKFPDLGNLPKTSEYLRAVGKEAGLKREPSLRTFENALKKAQNLRRSSP